MSVEDARAGCEFRLRECLPEAQGSGRSLSESFLHPGEYFFGAGNFRLRTLLGSCVSVALWNGACRMGALCHFVLPARLPEWRAEKSGPGRYGDEVIRWLASQCHRIGVLPGCFETYLIGGGSMIHSANPAGMPIGSSIQTVWDCLGGGSIGQRNVDSAHDQLARHGFLVRSEITGGTMSREVRFDLASGRVEVRSVPMPRTCPKLHSWPVSPR